MAKKKSSELVDEGVAMATMTRNTLKPLVYACIPALNEEHSIASVIVDAAKYVTEVFVCDDGSTDRTGEIAEAMGAYLIRHDVNKGKGASLRDLFIGASKSSPDVVVTIDADMQHDPRDIPRLIEPIINGSADIVVGSRFVKGGKSDMPLYRRIGTFLLNSHEKGEVDDWQSGLRAFSPAALHVMTDLKANGFGVETEQLLLARKHGLLVKEIPVEVHYNGLYKTSKMNPVFHAAEILGTTLRLVTEERPLLFFGLPAFMFMLGALFGGLQLLLEYNSSRIFSIPYAFMFLTCFAIGGMLAISALVLYAISRVKDRGL